MNPQDPLAALHPLREPAVIGWWPLAPGWWVLIALGVLATALLAYTLHKRYRKNAYRRQALLQLQDIRHEIAQLPEGTARTQSAAMETNALIKAVALRVFPQHDIAALSGEAWLRFLNETAHRTNVETTFPADFANAAYQRELPDLDTRQLFRAAENWIKTHRAAS